MEITDLVEKNTTLLRLGLHLEFNDARHRVAAHLQRNIDRSEWSLFRSYPENKRKKHPRCRIFKISARSGFTVAGFGIPVGCRGRASNPLFSDAMT